jgi:hypothetical protein
MKFREEQVRYQVKLGNEECDVMPSSVIFVFYCGKIPPRPPSLQSSVRNFGARRGHFFLQRMVSLKNLFTGWKSRAGFRL